MPPAAVGAAFVAMGASAATGVAIAGFVSAVYVGAAIGAVVGAGTALITGGDVMEGAIKGAVIGGITKGIGYGIGQLGSAGTTAGAGVGEAGLTAGAETATAAGAEAGTEVAAIGAADSVGNVAVQSAPIQVQAPVQAGFLDKAIGFIESNPKTSEIIAGGVAGAAKNVQEKRNRQEELQAQMERDRLMLDAQKIKGLENLNVGNAIPTVGGFLERPKWRLEDLQARMS